MTVVFVNFKDKFIPVVWRLTIPNLDMTLSSSSPIGKKLRD